MSLETDPLPHCVVGESILGWPGSLEQGERRCPLSWHCLG